MLAWLRQVRPGILGANSPAAYSRHGRWFCLAWGCLAFPAAIFVLALLWERTYLTWTHGPGLIGYGLAHSLWGPPLIVAWWLMALWVAVQAIRIVVDLLRRRRPRHALRVSLMLTALLAPFAPFGTWEALTVIALGAGPQGRNLMVEAGEQKSRLMVEVLTSKGITLNSRSDDGFTPLIVAADNASASFVEWLISRGADPNASSTLGTTPLIVAAKHNTPDVVRALVERGADPDHRDREGMTARDYAQARGDPAILEALRGKE